MCKRPTSSRKRRSAMKNWEDLKTDVMNPELIEMVEKRRKIKRQAPVPVETEEEIERRSYGSVLRYECGPARKFYDPEWEELYDERFMQCNWNNTWTKVDTIDDCVWVQCLYPPTPPPETLLTDTWSGDPVEFYDNVSYVCPGDDLFFEWDRDLESYNISCLPGGSWDEPIDWPICVPCKQKENGIDKMVIKSFFSCKLF